MTRRLTNWLKILRFIIKLDAEGEKNDMGDGRNPKTKQKKSRERKGSTNDYKSEWWEERGREGRTEREEEGD